MSLRAAPENVHAREPPSCRRHLDDQSEPEGWVFLWRETRPSSQCKPLAGERTALVELRLTSVGPELRGAGPSRHRDPCGSPVPGTLEPGASARRWEFRPSE